MTYQTDPLASLRAVLQAVRHSVVICEELSKQSDAVLIEDLDNDRLIFLVHDKTAGYVLDLNEVLTSGWRDRTSFAMVVDTQNQTVEAFSAQPFSILGNNLDHLILTFNEGVSMHVTMGWEAIDKTLTSAFGIDIKTFTAQNVFWFADELGLIEPEGDSETGEAPDETYALKA
jgi:hypothetical protein